jgi:glycosyltransferase involved in cell wall biosynthesis
MSLEMASKYKVLCFIPAKNCESTIAKTLEYFQGEILDTITEIVVIDNASSDQTVQRAKEALTKITTVKTSLFQNSQNYGLGGSHKIAFKYAMDNDYDYLLVVHGDASADIRQFMQAMKNYEFTKYDMVLSTRLASNKARYDYPTHRLWVNRLLSMFASLITMRTIKDFSAGPVNLYRVSTFLNKFENIIKRFSNDVAFPQFMVLYGAYRKADFYFYPLNHFEKDKKPMGKLVSQFGKSLILLAKYFFSPKKTIKFDVYGNYFGHNYRKIKIGHEVADLVVLQKPEIKVAATPVVIAQTPVTPLPVTPKEFKLLDLKRMGFEDQFTQTFTDLNMQTVEACDLTDESTVWIHLKLDVHTVISKGLKSFFLSLFKIYSDKRIILDISADPVLKTKQCYEFLSFCSRFKINTHLISQGSGETALWKSYSDVVENITLNFDHASGQRTKFYELVQMLGPKTKLNVNILSQPAKFYYGYGLMKKIQTMKLAQSVYLQPYSVEGDVEIPADHLEVLSNQAQTTPLSRDPGAVRKHYALPVKGTDSNKLIDSKGLGFSYVSSDANLKKITINEKGEVLIQKYKQLENIGSIFSDPGPLLQKISSFGMETPA